MKIQTVMLLIALFFYTLSVGLHVSAAINDYKKPYGGTSFFRYVIAPIFFFVFVFAQIIAMAGFEFEYWKHGIWITVGYVLCMILTVVGIEYTIKKKYKK